MSSILYFFEAALKEEGHWLRMTRDLNCSFVGSDLRAEVKSLEGLGGIVTVLIDVESKRLKFVCEVVQVQLIGPDGRLSCSSVLPEK
eukprot:11774295-Ditylum_brightwellii.AAC.1